MVGIYAITNKLNGKVYIGQSWDIARERMRVAHLGHKLTMEAIAKRTATAKSNRAKCSAQGELPWRMS